MMSRLAQAIADHIVTHVRAQVSNLQGTDAEFRAVFNGPPDHILQQVFDLLVQERGIVARLGSGEEVTIPILMQVDKLPEGLLNPAIGVSGICDDDHLMNLRNANNCPRFVGLVPPGGAANLSLTSTRSDFGISSQNNSGSASIDDWYGDSLIQELVKGALARNKWESDGQREDARTLIEHAIRSADEVDAYEVSRRDPWMVLSRLWSISDGKTPYCTQISLACGFPPCENGFLDTENQIRILSWLAEKFEGEGFRRTIDYLKERASDNTDLLDSLDHFLRHIQSKCDVTTSFERSAPYFYGPFIGEALDVPPEWWNKLTVEKWLDLFSGTYIVDPPPLDDGALELKCCNPIIQQIKGLVPIVESSAIVRLYFPEKVLVGQRFVITRKAGRGASGERRWDINFDGNPYVEIIDDDIPMHSKPTTYSAEAAEPGPKKCSLKLVSLKSWEPGVIICSRAASKVTLPVQSRTSKIAFEASLMLNGLGRHYVDIFVRPGVLVAEQAKRSDDSDTDELSQNSMVSMVSANEYGFEAEASGNCSYDIEITRPESAKSEVLRIQLIGEEVDSEVCSSEFERLIRLNRQRDGGRASTEVHINTQYRCTDLEGWLLDEGKISRSYYPIVLVQDYSRHWKNRDWASQEDTIFSSGKFLNDPRPRIDDMVPPEPFLKARAKLASLIRGEDGNGLIESARLGEWLASESDTEFAEILEDYLRSYTEWLEASPEVAAWCDVYIYTRFDTDGATLAQEPDAVLVSPMHPIRLAWHALAQRSLFLAYRKAPCPAASILDPDCVPDSILLPLRTASGGTKWQPYFSVECSSDYWSILWNATRLDRLARFMGDAPFDQEFGVQIGGVSSGFSVSQVHRALDDVSEMLVAKPVLNIQLSSASGQNNACNVGLMTWCSKHYSSGGREGLGFKALGPRLIQILDERRQQARPIDADISNLAEDTDNSVKWYSGQVSEEITPDLGIIAQLETSNAGHEEIRIGSPLAFGGLIRHRVRQQLKGGDGAFLCESRAAMPPSPTGDGLVDRTMNAICRLENLGQSRYGYTFAPSVQAIRNVLKRAQYAAVSSSAIDPACFLGGWLDDTYLWDYDLPSYSSRSGDSNGYYLLSKIKPIDIETLKLVLSRLPNCGDLSEATLNQIILEVARRGIPTVRGLSSGDSGASGDLGMFVASRLLQDEFRLLDQVPSLLPVLLEKDGITQISLLIPVDPFRGYIDDLTKAIAKPSCQRPDLLMVVILVADSKICCKLTPIEVKFRGSKDPMTESARRDALGQATSLSTLLDSLITLGREPKMELWQVAFQHLVASVLDFGFRVYSQQVAASAQSTKWAAYHTRIIESVFSREINLEIDSKGRLIVIDASNISSALDHDGDRFEETISINHSDAAKIVSNAEDGARIYSAIKARVGVWNLLPEIPRSADNPANSSSHPAPMVAPSPDPQPTENGSSSSGAMGGMDATSTKVDAPLEVPYDSQNAARDLHFKIGNTVQGFQNVERSLNLSDTSLNHLNIGVVGDLGTGKTQLLKSLIFQISHGADSNQGVKPRILLFDYKKDYSSSDFVMATEARVIKPYHLPLNLFDLSDAGDSLVPWLDRFRFFADVIGKIFPNVGHVQRANLKNAIRNAYDQCDGLDRQPNIYDVHENYHRIIGENRADSVSSILDDLVDMELFTPNPEESMSFSDFLDGVVVIALNELGQDDSTKNMLVAIMLNMFYEHMLKIPKRPFTALGDKQLRVVDSYLLVDEADNIMRYEFDVLRKILLQGREFGVGVILASQYLRHFKAGATDYREPLLSWFIHKVPNVTAQELSALGFTGDTSYLAELAEGVKALALHECLYKSHDNPGEILKGTPFYKLIQATEV